MKRDRAELDGLAMLTELVGSLHVNLAVGSAVCTVTQHRNKVQSFLVNLPPAEKLTEHASQSCCLSYLTTITTTHSHALMPQSILICQLICAAHETFARLVVVKIVGAIHITCRPSWSGSLLYPAETGKILAYVLYICFLAVLAAS